MCGIAGYFNIDATPDALMAALHTIAHRGPDDQQMRCAENSGIGIRRLAIIDLAGGKQPMVSRDGKLSLVFNGEIYNYVELRKELQSNGFELRTNSDTETILHLYEWKKENLFSYLRGMFAFALWDQRRNSLMLARDRFGKKPLYYRLAGKGILFASELKAMQSLSSQLNLPLTTDQQAIYDYLSLGIIPQPSTIYKEVRSIPAASFLHFEDSGMQIKRYWELKYGDATPSYQEAVEKVRDLVGESVRIRLRSDVPVGILLSGGVDSTVVTLEAVKHSSKPVQTFTIATGDRESDESAIARRTAQSLNIPNSQLELKYAPVEELMNVVNYYDQPFADPSTIPSLVVSRLAREHVKVVLNGDGGDEMFCGYRRYLAAHYSKYFGWTTAAFKSDENAGPSMKSRRSIVGFGTRFLRGLGEEKGSRYIVWTSDLLTESQKANVWLGEKVTPTESWIEDQMPSGLTPLRTQIDADIRIMLASMLLVKMDVASMASSLEARSPLLDHVIAEYVSCLPDSYLLRKGRLKALLKDAYRNQLPDEVRKGKKRGFEIPLRRWLEGELRELTFDMLNGPGCLSSQFISSEFLDKVLNKKIALQQNWPSLVYALLILELFLRRERHS